MTLSFWQTCISAFGCGGLMLLAYRALFAPLSKLPGPWYTLFSDVFLMCKEFTGQRRVYIHELHKDHGPVVRLGPNEVSFTSGDALKEIYQSGGSGYDKTEFYHLFIQYGTRTTFSTSEKREHDLMKRNIAGPYTNSSIMSDEVLDGVQERVSMFLKQCEKAGKSTLDFYDLLHCYAVDCASFHLLHPHGTRSLEGRDLHLMQEYSYGDTLPTKMCRYRFPTLMHFYEIFTKKNTDSQIGTFVLNACAQPTTPPPHSLASKLKTNTSANLSQIQVAAECMNHLAAGIDTTGDALCFLIHKISQPDYHHVQERLIRELISKPNNTVEELLYMEAVIKEGLRCFPPIPMSQPRYVPVGGRVIDGCFIPGKTIVSCQAWSLHLLNEDIFHNATQFNPDRWLDKDKETVVEMNRLFFAFSAGGRGCTGKHLALLEMKCLLRGLYSRYGTRIAPEMKASMELFDQAISTRPKDRSCLLVLERL